MLTACRMHAQLTRYPSFSSLARAWRLWHPLPVRVHPICFGCGGGGGGVHGQVVVPYLLAYPIGYLLT